MIIHIEEKLKTFKELKKGAIFKILDNGVVNEDDLYMKVLVNDNYGGDSFMGLSLKNAHAYKFNDSSEVTEFKNSTFTITIEY